VEHKSLFWYCPGELKAILLAAVFLVYRVSPVSKQSCNLERCKSEFISVGNSERCHMPVLSSFVVHSVNCSRLVCGPRCLIRYSVEAEGWVAKEVIFDPSPKARDLLLLLLLLLLSSSSSSSLSPLCRVFVHIFLRQTISLRITMLQLFCRYCLWRPYH
jgi:hypothetical protein